MGDRYLDLLDRRVRDSVFNRLNPCQRGTGINNCDAAAASLFNYLESGIEVPAICLEMGQLITIEPNTWSRPISLRELMRRVLQGGHGTQVLVKGERNSSSRFTSHHVFNLVNIDPPDGIRRRGRGHVHAVDAYANVLVPDWPSPTFEESYRAIHSFYMEWNEIRRLRYRTSSYRVTV